MSVMMSVFDERASPVRKRLLEIADEMDSLLDVSLISVVFVVLFVIGIISILIIDIDFLLLLVPLVMLNAEKRKQGEERILKKNLDFLKTSWPCWLLSSGIHMPMNFIVNV